MVKKWKKKLYNFKQLESAWFMGRNSKFNQSTFTRRLRKSLNTHYSKMPRIWKRGNETEPSPWCLESQTLHQGAGENSQPTPSTTKGYVKTNMNLIYM
jgi:hypothetical protein